MKALSAVLLAAVLLVAGPAGCSDDSTKPDAQAVDTSLQVDALQADAPQVDAPQVAVEAGGGEAGGEAGQPADGASKKTFGESCAANDECESNVCHEFGDGTKACTQTCSNDADCPSGSQGQKCNKQGVCRT